MFITKTGYSTYTTLMSDLIADLKTIGFTEILANPLIMEAGATIDPLSTTQAWRISIRVNKSKLVMYSGTDQQLKDDGSLDKPLKHYFCSISSISGNNLFDYIISSTDHGVSLSIHPQAGDYAHPNWHKVGSTSQTIRTLRTFNGKIYVLGDPYLITVYDPETNEAYGTETSFNNVYDILVDNENKLYLSENDTLRLFDNITSIDPYLEQYMTSSNVSNLFNDKYSRIKKENGIYVSYVTDWGTDWRGRSWYNSIVYTSTDGRNFEQKVNLNAGNSQTNFMDIKYNDNTWLIATGGSYFFYSVDNGATWSTPRPNSSRNIYCIANNGKTGVDSIWIMGSHYANVYKTVDQGTTITSHTISDIAGNVSMTGVEFIPDTDKFVMCTANGYILESADGETWTELFKIDQQLNTMLYENGVIYVGGNNSAFYKSEDYGASWTSISLAFNKVNGYVDDSMNIKLMSGEYNWTLSTDGMTQNTITTPRTEYATGIATNDQFGSSSVWVATFNYSHIYYSLDDGVTWNNYNFGRTPTDIAHHNGVFVVVASDNYFAWSIDGSNWSRPTLGRSGVQHIDHNGQTGDNCLWITSGTSYGCRSTTGTSFESDTRIPSGCIKHNKKTINGFWLCVRNNAAYKSYDGIYWEELDISFLPNRNLSTVEVVNGSFIISTTGRELYVTNDGYNFKTLFDNTIMHNRNFYNYVKYAKSFGLDNCMYLQTNNPTVEKFDIIPTGSVVCIQRPVNKSDGVTLTTGKAPVIQYGSTSYGSNVISVLREADVTQPTPYKNLDELSEICMYGLPLYIPVNNDNLGNTISVFAYGINTGRNFYQVELDMLGVVSDSNVLTLDDVTVNIYNSTRTYHTIPMLRTANNSIDSATQARHIIYKS